jgi:uncharacterized RmlC-like cupin family protein
MEKQLHFLAYNKLPAVSRGEGIVNHPVAGSKQGATRIHSGLTWLPAGAQVPNHCHPNAEEQVTVLQGQVRIKIGDMVRDCEPYDSTFISGSVPHEFSNIGDQPALVMVIYGVLNDKSVTRTFTDTGETVEIGSERDRFPPLQS